MQETSPWPRGGRTAGGSSRRPSTRCRGRRRQQRQEPPDLRLQPHDLRRRHRPREDEDADERQAHRETVGDDLGRRADRARRVRRAGRPAAEHDAVHADGRAREDASTAPKSVKPAAATILNMLTDGSNGMTGRTSAASRTPRSSARRCRRALSAALTVTSSLNRSLSSRRRRTGAGRTGRARRGQRLHLHARDDLALEPDREQHARQQEDDDRDGLEQPGSRSCRC